MLGGRCHISDYGAIDAVGCPAHACSIRYTTDLVKCCIKCCYSAAFKLHWLQMTDLVSYNAINPS